METVVWGQHPPRALLSSAPGKEAGSLDASPSSLFITESFHADPSHQEPFPVLLNSFAYSFIHLFSKYLCKS